MKIKKQPWLTGVDLIDSSVLCFCQVEYKNHDSSLDWTSHYLLFSLHCLFTFFEVKLRRISSWYLWLPRRIQYFRRNQTNSGKSSCEKEWLRRCIWWNSRKSVLEVSGFQVKVLVILWHLFWSWYCRNWIFFKQKTKLNHLTLKETAMLTSVLALTTRAEQKRNNHEDNWLIEQHLRLVLFI